MVSRGSSGESRRKYYWLLATEPETGKLNLIFGGSTEDEARHKGLEMLSGIDFEIRELPTRSQPAASAMIRGKRLETTHSLKRASEKIGHERSIYKMRRKYHGS